MALTFLTPVVRRDSSRACSHGKLDGRRGFWDAIKGRPGKRGFAKVSEGFSAEGVAGIIVAIQTNGLSHRKHSIEDQSEYLRHTV